LADVKGHDFSDAILVGMLHQAFLTGVLYELEHKGQVTTTLFEILNTRFYRSSSIDDFLTMIYGEINEQGLFKFISAGHPKPLIFSSKYDRFVQIAEEIVVNYPPIGLMPSPGNFDTIPSKSILGIKEKYTISTLNLMGTGDILLLYTDGLSDMTDSRNQSFLPNILETIFKDIKDKSSRFIFNTVKDYILKNSRTMQDDISFVIVKRTVPD
jgi:serine phosphatase RsbU (regulator of sigma subunit)